jgi:hypothetical protein
MSRKTDQTQVLQDPAPMWTTSSPEHYFEAAPPQITAPVTPLADPGGRWSPAARIAFVLTINGAAWGLIYALIG